MYVIIIGHLSSCKTKVQEDHQYHLFFVFFFFLLYEVYVLCCVVSQAHESYAIDASDIVNM
jgi:hypothetical protein